MLVGWAHATTNKNWSRLIQIQNITSGATSCFPRCNSLLFLLFSFAKSQIINDTQDFRVCGQYFIYFILYVIILKKYLLKKDFV